MTQAKRGRVMFTWPNWADRPELMLFESPSVMQSAEIIVITPADLAAEIAEAEERGARRMHSLIGAVWREGVNIAPIQSKDTAMTMWRDKERGEK